MQWDINIISGISGLRANINLIDIKHYPNHPGCQMIRMI